jgi:N-acetylmuramoyl-L-alanine amidase
MNIKAFPNSEYRSEIFINFGKETFEQIMARKKCNALCNLGYFDMNEYLKAKTKEQVIASTECDMIVDGSALRPLKFVEFGICINDNGELSCGIAEGQKNYCIGLPPQYINGNKYCNNNYVADNGCTHIGFRADGTPIIALVSKDMPMSNDELNQIMMDYYDCVTILRYDGSWSSQGNLGDGEICKPSQTRIVQSLLLLYKRDTAVQPVDKYTIIKNNLLWNGNLVDRKLTTHVVWHHASGYGSVEDIHAFHRSLGWLGIAYHFYVRMDGTIYQGRPIGSTGGHTLNYNNCSIGVCAEGNFQNIDEMSTAQRESLKWLAGYIKSLYPSAVNNRHLDLNQTACPGSNYPFSYIVGATPQVPPTTGDVVVIAGSGIKLFQTWLNTFYSSNLVADGVYGAKTKLAAVKAYQKFLNRTYSAGLTVDGVFGNKSQSAVRNLRRGNKGDDVTILQGMLYCVDINPNGIDGTFGTGTFSAVKSYQSIKGLSADGVAGKQVFKALML